MELLSVSSIPSNDKTLFSDLPIDVMARHVPGDASFPVLRNVFLVLFGRSPLSFKRTGGLADQTGIFVFSFQDARFVLARRDAFQKAGHKMRINLAERYKGLYLKLLNVPVEFAEHFDTVFPPRLGAFGVSVFLFCGGWKEED